MAIRRRCRSSRCKNGRRCLEHLRFDVMYQGARYRMPVNEFAIPRMEPGKQRPIQSMEEARDWERLFIGEIKAGRDPRRPRVKGKATADKAPASVSEFLDAYVERCVRPAALRSVKSVKSRVDVLKKHLGELALDALEEPDEINRFKTDSDYAEDVEIATIHRALETPSRSDELGHGADAIVLQEVAVSSVRRAHEQEAGDITRPPADARGREAAARHGA